MTSFTFSVWSVARTIGARFSVYIISPEWCAISGLFTADIVPVAELDAPVTTSVPANAVIFLLVSIPV